MNDRKTRVISLAVVAVLCAVVIGQTWRPSVSIFDGPTFFTWLVPGLAIGAIYATSALGLVVTYTTTGVFNFAHGAVGCLCAFMYWETRVRSKWPAPVALVFVIFVFAPLMGLLLERVLMRRVRNAPLVVQLMVTVGLMISIMGICYNRWDPQIGRSLPAFFEGSSGVEVGPVIATWHRILMLGTALVIALILRVLLYRTRLGVAMRAVVDNRSLADLNGINANVVSGASWALGCMLAAVAGIFIAPELGTLSVDLLTLSIVAALAASAIGGLKSLPITFLGGLFVGLSETFVRTFLEFDGVNWPRIPEAMPGLILFVALFFLPPARLETGRIKVTKRTTRLTSPTEAAVGAGVVVLLTTAWAYGWIPWFTGTTFGQRSDLWLTNGIGALIAGLVMLSLVPLIGWAGQVTFANFAIMAFGACMYAKVGGQDGNPMGIVWTVLMCAPLGVAVAVPALRMKGLYLALATIAFSDIAQNVLFLHPSVLNNNVAQGQGSLFKPLQIFGLTLSSDPDDRKLFLAFIGGCFALIFFGVVLLRRSRWARRWIAAADSPAAAATVGINLTVGKVVVFALSGAIAGFAGTMYGLANGSLQPDKFTFFAGVSIVLLLAAQGARFPIAAFLGALGLMFFPALQQLFGNPKALASLELIGPGIAAMVMAYRPEGGVFYAGRDLARLLPWRADAKQEHEDAIVELRQRDIRRDEIGEIGLSRPYEASKMFQLDRVLGIADDVTIVDHKLDEEVANAAPTS